MFAQLASISLGAILVENFVLVRFLGICPFLGVSKSIKTATGMGCAVAFVMTLASAVTWMVHSWILAPLHIEYFRTLAFILVIAVLVQAVETMMKKSIPTLYEALGIYLPLITTNCAVLGVAIMNIDKGYNFIESITFGFTAAVGFTLAVVLFAGVRERLEFSDNAKCLDGFPIALISAGLIALAFMGFAG